MVIQIYEIKITEEFLNIYPFNNQYAFFRLLLLPQSQFLVYLYNPE